MFQRGNEDRCAPRRCTVCLSANPARQNPPELSIAADSPDIARWQTSLAGLRGCSSLARGIGPAMSFHCIQELNMKTTPKLTIAALIAALSLGFAPTASARSGHGGHHGHHGGHALHHSHGRWQAHHRHSSDYYYRPSYYRGYSSAPSYYDDYRPSYYGWGGHGLPFVIAGHHHHHHH